MTPEQKIKLTIMVEDVKLNDDTPDTHRDAVNTATSENVDDVYDKFYVEADIHWDLLYEFRGGEVETNIGCDWSRHYESKSVAAKMSDGSWVGWTYWYGGGKHSEPESIDWMSESYFIDCEEEEKLVTVRTFTRQETK